jgi:hypothetical protein
MVAFKDLWCERSRCTWISTFDDRPGKLFDIEHIRVAICLSDVGDSNKQYTTNYTKFATEYRSALFETLFYGENISQSSKVITKRNTRIDEVVYGKLSSNKPLSYSMKDDGTHNAYYHNAPQYFIRAMSTVPYFWNEQAGEKTSSQIKSVTVDTQSAAEIVGAALNSSLFYWWYILFSDCRHLTNREIYTFPLQVELITPETAARLSNVYQILMQDFECNKFRKECNYKSTGKVIYDEYYPKLSKPIIDQIDAILAEHYGFTEEELDYIINYDIKYRMGLGGTEDDDG